MTKHSCSPAASLTSPTEVLLRSVHDRDVERFETALALTPDVNELSAYGFTAFTSVLDEIDRAVERRESPDDILLTMAEKLQAAGARDFRPALKAARQGDLEGLKRLISSGVPANFANPVTGTALDIATRRGDESMVAYLEQCGGICRRPPASLESEVMVEYEKLHAFSEDMADLFLEKALCTARHFTNPYVFEMLQRAAAATKGTPGGDDALLDRLQSIAMSPLRLEESIEKLRNLICTAFLKTDSAGRGVADVKATWAARRIRMRSLLHRVAGKGDLDWVIQLRHEGADPMWPVLDSIDITENGAGHCCSLSFSTPAHAALATPDPEVFIALAEDSRVALGFVGRMLERMLYTLLHGKADRSHVAPQFERIANLRRVVLSWQIPASESKRRSTLQRIERYWERFAELRHVSLDGISIRGDSDVLPATCICQLVDLAASNFFQLLLAIPTRQKTTDWGCRLIEEVREKPGCRHLAVLFVTGLPVSRALLLEAIGLDLRSIAERVIVLSETSFSSHEDFYDARGELVRTLERLCKQARDLASDLPGTDDFLTKSLPTESSLMRKWICAMHRQIDGKDRELARTFGRAWAVDIRSLAADCLAATRRAVPC